MAFLCDHQLFLPLIMVPLTFPAKGQSLETELGILAPMAANNEPQVRRRRNALGLNKACQKLNFDIKP